MNKIPSDHRAEIDRFFRSGRARGPSDDAARGFRRQRQGLRLFPYSEHSTNREFRQGDGGQARVIGSVPGRGHGIAGPVPDGCGPGAERMPDGCRAVAGGQREGAAKIPSAVMRHAQLVSASRVGPLPGRPPRIVRISSIAGQAGFFGGRRKDATRPRPAEAAAHTGKAGGVVGTRLYSTAPTAATLRRLDPPAPLRVCTIAPCPVASRLHEDERTPLLAPTPRI